jgi:hypothetical protein
VAAICSTCGAHLGMGRRLTGATRCEGCEDAARRAQEAARQATEARATRILYLVQGYIEDEQLSEQEESGLIAAAHAEGMTQAEFNSIINPYTHQMLIARFNAGRIAPLASCAIFLKAGERAALEVDAQLLKEVVDREMQGGSHGYSFHIAKGVTYRTGQFRAKSVVVGSHLEAADTGTLTVTTQRAVFKGLRHTVEADLKKLVGVNLFDDGIQLHVSNRKNASQFKVADGYLVGAALSAVMQLP